MQMKFRMERQQLRHDEQMANRKIEERDRIDDVFRAIYGDKVLPASNTTPMGNSSASPSTKCGSQPSSDQIIPENDMDEPRIVMARRRSSKRNKTLNKTKQP